MDQQSRSLGMAGLVLAGFCFAVWAAMGSAAGRGLRPRLPKRPPAGVPWGIVDGDDDGTDDETYYVCKFMDHSGHISFAPLTKSELKNRLKTMKAEHQKALKDWEKAKKAGKATDKDKPTKPKYKYTKAASKEDAMRQAVEQRRKHLQEQLKKRASEGTDTGKLPPGGADRLRDRIRKRLGDPNAEK